MMMVQHQLQQLHLHRTGILETRQREYNNTRVVTIGGSENRRRRRRI